MSVTRRLHGGLVLFTAATGTTHQIDMRASISHLYVYACFVRKGHIIQINAKK